MVLTLTDVTVRKQIAVGSLAVPTYSVPAASGKDLNAATESAVPTFYSNCLA